MSVLNKGLKFCPAPKGINYTQLLADLYRLETKMAWHHLFKDFENDTQSEEKLAFPFPEKSKRTNMPKEYPKEIKEFTNSVRSDLFNRFS